MSSFDPSLSTTTRPSPLPPPSTTTNLADSLPQINFDFDSLRDRMSKFTLKFDSFIESGRKRVLSERNQFRLNVAELQEDHRMKKKDIEILQLKTSSYQQTIAKEAAETREMQQAIASLTAQRDRQLAQRDSLRQQIEAAQREIEERLQKQREHQKKLEAQARYNVPELDFWVTNLCLRIEGAGKEDRLKFVYTHVDEKDWEREAWFELAMGGREYDVKHCRPKLEKDKVERVLDRVNETRELVGLLKGMRELFVEAMKS
ncbi:uncharacterized protein PODANS_3_8940 [Podospora anserina S mat+]|uniref:Kinetochore protein SPC25 n=5 Tax=Podospora TaxID=5144 RepID=B2B1D3_PODAN|nr:uncharacterized protein PODANS_3_8940 [Podospora anserina S mat+]KAK4644893.1 kinetochore-associated Ndc80 complex subunit spc25 [Podospora bellae-mahoneyi]KAK4656171.1 kinetochore-associated Ndc80 complex subunit spc25 [Podospora pseudocomata]KAK4678581.1 kinetochore-associated Ndc80 complex subunit spc25 [Podospora pseudoanserina]VBB78069.1 Putative kinetochore protein spc-25 [Podospora comata]CAP70835.1 unnamed protein product [Podospora anserina S mat+]